MGLEEVWNFVVEKLKEALLALENLGGSVLSWFDKVFPPETRGDKINHWFHVALPYIIAAVVLALLVCFCCCCKECCFRCCLCIGRSFGGCCRCCGCSFWRCFRGFWGCFRGCGRGFRGCFRGCGRGFRGCFHSCRLGLAKMMGAIRRCCCCCGRGRPWKMMKAPGRNCKMPRSVFEANPKGYFSNLRGHPGDQLC